MPTWSPSVPVELGESSYDACHCLLPLVPRPPASLPSSSISQSLMLVPGVIRRVQGCTEQESRRTEAPAPPLSGLASVCFSVSTSCWGSDQAATSWFSQLPDLAPLLSTKAGNGVGGLAWLLEPSVPSALDASPPPVSEAPATAVLVQWACCEDGHLLGHVFGTGVFYNISH